MTKISKEEAARILGAKNVRTVERLASKGKLSVTYEKGTTRDVPMYDEDEVRHLAGQPRTAAQPAVVTEPSQAIATRNDNGDNRLSQAVAFLLDREQRRKIEPSVDPASKLMLTLPDAAALTSLSAGHLREAIRAGKLKGKIIGRGWKIKRTDLDAYVRKL